MLRGNPRAAGGVLKHGHHRGAPHAWADYWSSIVTHLGASISTTTTYRSLPLAGLAPSSTSAAAARLALLKSQMLGMIQPIGLIGLIMDVAHARTCCIRPPLPCCSFPVAAAALRASCSTWTTIRGGLASNKGAFVRSCAALVVSTRGWMLPVAMSAAWMSTRWQWAAGACVL